MTKEIEIPTGYEAKIEGNKVIFVSKESEDERIRKELVDFFQVWQIQHNELPWRGLNVGDILTWLEKQKEQKPIENIELEKEIKNWSFGLAGHDAEDWAGPTARYFFKLGQDSIKPAEWSEEDKGILLECILTLQNSSHWLLADKLSSLRPQPHWKPSEEQIRSLEWWKNYSDNLESLYNDLKKL